MAGRDQYMNFFTLEVTTGASSATLVSADFNTGAGVSTQLAWRIHTVEWFIVGSWSGAADTNNINLAISTRKDQSAVPALTDKGCIAKYRAFISLWGTAGNTLESRYPVRQEYLPPILVASPNFTIYYKGSADFAGMQAQNVQARIGFTTEKLTESAYREVFETWNYAN